MIYYIKKTGRTFDNKRSVLNHIRHVYGKGRNNFELAYLENNDLNNKPVCEICGKEVEYINFIRGYKKYCKYCKKNVIGNSKRVVNRYSNIKYDEFVKNNIDWYRNNLGVGQVIDIYDNKLTCKRGLKSKLTYKLVHNDIKNDDYWLIEKKCSICNKKYKISLLHKYFNSRKHCGNRSCINSLKYNGENFNVYNIKINFDNLIEINHFIYDNYINLKYSHRQMKKILNTRITDNNIKNNYAITVYTKKSHKALTNIYFCKEENLYFPIVYKGKPYIKRYFDNKHDKKYYINYLMRNHPECFEYCKSCNTKFLAKDIITNHVLRDSGLCSEKCYHKYMKTKEWQCINGQTQEKRNKQSERMKNLISTGKFTPCVTNSRCKSRVEVLINNKIVPCRSSWDATFLILNPNLEYEKLRIKYNYENKNHNYIVDFIDIINMKIYEIKPINAFTNKDQVKQNSAIEWCKNNKYEYLMITDDWFNKNLKIESNIIKIKEQKESELILKRMKQFLVKG